MIHRSRDKRDFTRDFTRDFGRDIAEGFIKPEAASPLHHLDAVAHGESIDLAQEREKIRVHQASSQV